MTFALIEHFGDETFASREPLAVDEYAVPNVIEIDGDFLTWQYTWKKPHRPHRIMRPQARMLPQFLALAETNVTDEKIVAFARKWGVLYLCKEHWTPASHNPFCEPFQRERLSEWRFLARQMKAALEIAVRLDRDGQLGRHEDWRVLDGEDYCGEFNPGRPLPHREAGWRATRENLLKALSYEKSDIGRHIDGWLAIGGVRPRTAWYGDQLSITLEGSPQGKLMGALAIQLMHEVGRCTFLFCRNCRKAFMPKTRQARYCPACQEAGVPQQRATDRRNRKRSKAATD